VLIPRTWVLQTNHANMPSKRKSVAPPRYGSMLPVPKRKNVVYRSQMFRGVVDPVVDDATATVPVTSTFTSSVTGTISNLVLLAPKGVDSIATVGGPSVNVFRPRLPWLYNTGLNFEKVRFSNAKLVVVGNVGSTATGTIAFQSSPDFSDGSINLSTAIVGGASTDAATLSAKNWEIPLDFNTGWMKFSSLTLASSGGNFLPITNVNDIALTTISMAGAGLPNSTTIFRLYVKYDVEFSGPVQIGANQ
jgi:hypothetical protein